MANQMELGLNGDDVRPGPDDPSVRINIAKGEANKVRVKTLTPALIEAHNLAKQGFGPETEVVPLRNAGWIEKELKEVANKAY